MNNVRLTQILALVACALLVTCSAMLTPAINKGRSEMGMAGITDENPLLNTPPEYAVAVQALGAFRGMLTNFAFMRANNLQEQGRYYDAYQLAEWICTLQPRFPSVWEFNAWNMSWNISVTTHTPQERWHWVYNGIKLLRDRGIKWNPRAVNLYKQIAWTYVNKMSETIDDHHLTYKRMWAWHMHLVMGEPPDPLAELSRAMTADEYREMDEDALIEAAIAEHNRREKRLDQVMRKRGVSEEERREILSPVDVERKRELARTEREMQGERPTIERMARVATYAHMLEIDAAPTSLAELYRRRPETEAMVAELRKIGADITDEPLTETEYWRQEGLGLSFFFRYREITSQRSMLERVLKNPIQHLDAEAVERFREIMTAPQHEDAARALVAFLQRKVLSEVYKLEPAHMATVVAMFGPMDWRSVDAHSLYWVSKAIMVSGETISRFSNDKTNTTRLIFFSLRNLYLRNKIIFDPFLPNPALSYIDFTPDLRFIESMNRAYLRYGKLLSPDMGGHVDSAGETFRAGHVNFLSESIRILWLYDRLDEANKYYEQLRTTYQRNQSGDFNPAFSMTMEEYAAANYMDSLEGPRETMTAIHALFEMGFLAITQRNYRRYNKLKDKAEEIYNQFTSGRTDIEYKKLPALADIHIDSFMNYLARPALTFQHTLHKATLWQRAPVDLKRAAYDPLVQVFRQECEQSAFDPAKAFPEPSGMEDYRATHEPRKLPGADQRFNTPVQAPGG